jgi:hypothetical protein
MRVLIINGANNKNVFDSTEIIKANVGNENVDVISYGWEGNNRPENVPTTIKRSTPSNNDQELIANLNKVDIRGEYDLLLISGGHGDCNDQNTAKKLSRTEFNSLTNKGAEKLIKHLADKDVKFKNILLGTCFSANYQNDFKPLLKNDDSVILSCTTISPANLCNIAEEIAQNKQPDLRSVINGGMALRMEELNNARMMGEEYLANGTTRSLSDTENFLLDTDEYGKYSKLEIQSTQTTNVYNNLNVDEAHNILDIAERFDNLKEKIDDFPITNKQEIKEKLEKASTKLQNIYKNFVGEMAKKLSEQIDSSNAEKFIKQYKNKAKETSPNIHIVDGLKLLDEDIEGYNNSSEVTELKESLTNVVKDLKNAKEDALQEFIEKNEVIIKQTNDSDIEDKNKLKGCISSSFCLSQGNNIYVQKLEYLPISVVDPTQGETEYNEQLRLSEVMINNMEKDKSITIKDYDTPEFFKIYRDKSDKAITETMAKEIDAIFDVQENFEPTNIVADPIQPIFNKNSKSTQEFKIELQSLLQEKVQEDEQQEVRREIPGFNG